MALEGEFVSEAITPDPGTFDAAAMARGQPGLPAGFTWRGRHYVIRELLESWKQTEAEGHRRGGERYYRKHYFRVWTDSGETMTIYAVRHVKPGENARRRWWLYSIDRGQA
ncbi:MAG: cytoplasmic protein [Phycisphaerae bacterium]|nr:cytoplasmic protein [Phycisphaerae bacterium]